MAKTFFINRRKSFLDFFFVKGKNKGGKFRKKFFAEFFDCFGVVFNFGKGKNNRFRIIFEKDLLEFFCADSYCCVSYDMLFKFRNFKIRNRMGRTFSRISESFERALRRISLSSPAAIIGSPSAENSSSER